ncbi:hypothetical protein [Lysobacter xanthus]
MSADKWHSLLIVLVIGAATAAVVGLLLERLLRGLKNMRPARGVLAVVFYFAFSVLWVAVHPHHVRDALLFGIQSGLLGVACAQFALFITAKAPRHVA